MIRWMDFQVSAEVDEHDDRGHVVIVRVNGHEIGTFNPRVELEVERVGRLLVREIHDRLAG